MDTRIEEDIVNSDVMIYDCANLTFNHVLKYTPVAVKKLDLILVFKKKIISYMYILYI